MDASPFSIQPVRVWDLPRLTQMAYENMTGVDVEFTRFARHRLARLLGHLVLPLYLLTAGRGFKAVVDGEIAGCAYLHLRQVSGTVFNVSVNRAYRRQGIGRALMHHIEEQVRAARLRWLALQVDKDNWPAQQLYQSLGYRPYHPYYLRSLPAATFIGRGQEKVSLEALTHYEGRHLFRRYTDLERRQGDSWAAPVLQQDFPDPPPPAGYFWRCLHGQEEIGCVWQNVDDARASVILLLRPEYWEESSITRTLLQRLQAQRRQLARSLDISLGSSSHHAAITPSLLELGFEPARHARILMLKQVGEAD